MSLKFKFYNKRISGVLTVLPQKEVSFDEEMANYNFSSAQSIKLKLAMGYNKHRIVEESTNISDMCIFGLNYLFDNQLLKKEDISVLILVTQSPEHFMPPTSNIIQGKLGLNTNVLCLDICQGCAGFEIGLIEAYMLLDQASINKIVLMNADVLSRKVSRRDRNSFPLIGDAACITVVERSTIPTTINAIVSMDGKDAYVLQIPAGGFRMPSSLKTAEMHGDAAGNFRSLDNLVMEGDRVFSFVQTTVPPMIEELLILSDKTKEEIDWYLFHQPNKFMLQKLADKIGVSRTKMPANIVENFGNASSATVPTNICFNLAEQAHLEIYEVCFAGFGVGLTWSAIQQQLGKLMFNKIIYY